jgi:hypothetical protein
MAPVQRALGVVLEHARGLRAVARGEDALLGAWLCGLLLGLGLCSLLLAAAWELLYLALYLALPWGSLLGGAVRLAGLALLGPHMRLLGAMLDKDGAEWDGYEATLAAATEPERRRMQARAEARLNATPAGPPLSVADVLVRLARRRQAAEARRRDAQTHAEQRARQRRQHACSAEHVLLVPGHRLIRGKKPPLLDPARSTISVAPPSTAPPP